MVWFYFLVLVAVIAALVYLWCKAAPASPGDSLSEGQRYPFREEVEERLSDGSITTHGYAARHPQEFRHWACGPYVMGERIDSRDWEEWRANYFGE